jgi:glyoxylase-like metal-dependent hydrolase (beta-lactamase superfamily II)
MPKAQNIEVSMLAVLHFELSVNYANAYVLYDKITRDAVLVDCGEFDKRIAEALASLQLSLSAILITHSHYDHVGGLDAFREKFPVPVYARAMPGTTTVEDGDVIPFSAREIQVLATPGHIDDGISFYVAPYAFVGDAIFAGAVGGTSDRARFLQEVSHVRDQIFNLPDATIIYSGHGAPTSVAIERLFNPFFV